MDINVNYSIKLKFEKKNWVAKNDNDGIDINEIIEKCDDNDDYFDIIEKRYSNKTKKVNIKNSSNDNFTSIEYCHSIIQKIKNNNNIKNVFIDQEFDEDVNIINCKYCANCNK